jgi:tetratricopeptide (TPR) repeat protein
MKRDGLVAAGRRAAATLAAVVSLATGVGAGAQSSLPDELEVIARTYHQAPERLDGIRQALKQAVDKTPTAELLVALARAHYNWAEVRATTDDEKLDAFEDGREAAKRAIDLEARNARAHFWYATNTAKWGQLTGISRSLQLLPEIRREVRIVLDLEPQFASAYVLAGNLAAEVPGILGGSLDRAEQTFRKGLAVDPRLTALRVGLAHVLARRGQVVEARQELTAVLNETQPSNVADWTVKDAPEARQQLEALKDKP